ncbi:hypothetical protein TNCV_2925201 [Trichonephila clavipes]|nr:hypothetical protein TNCV_2925201 [Trichonephila clavipes]
MRSMSCSGMILNDWVRILLAAETFVLQFNAHGSLVAMVMDSWPESHEYEISSPRQHHLQSSSLQYSHTSAFGSVVAGNSSGRRVLEGPSGDYPFLPETLQLR